MGLSMNELCCLFCCPPCPSSFVNKMTFNSPEPTYTIVNGDQIQLSERAAWQYEEEDKKNLKVFQATTKHGNEIVCLFVNCVPNPRFTILFSLGNAGDLGMNISFLLGLGTRINCNIFSYDYSGYGASKGKFSEKNMYADIEAAWDTMRNIVLFGECFGASPTIDFASKNCVQSAGVILTSPFTSCFGIAFPHSHRSCLARFFDAFKNIDKIGKVSCPVLVIHGTEDEIVDFSHGLMIYEACTEAVEPLWIEGAGNGDLMLYTAYLQRIKDFVNTDLSK